MQQHTVAILGAGMSGLCMAIKLKEAGVHDIVLLEKTGGVGGTWHDNTYPGACCDVASVLYSYSFEPNPDWSRAYSPQAEILAYFEHCADKYQLRQHIRFNSEVTSAEYREATGDWLLTLSSGEQLCSRVLVSGLGQLNLPHTPEFPGREQFAGDSFHSARWDHSVDLHGKRVAVIGNAASAIQFIPVIGEQAEQVYVYQRSANFILPRNDRMYSDEEKRRFRRWPWLQRLLRLRWYLRQELIMFGAMLKGTLRRALIGKMVKGYLEQTISDPQRREQLTPDYPLGCKRALVSDDYLPALENQPIELVTSPIRGIDATGVETEDGIERPVDVLIYGTGFRATEFLAPLAIRGEHGRDLNDAWRDGAEAHRGAWRWRASLIFSCCTAPTLTWDTIRLSSWWKPRCVMSANVYRRYSSRT